jgi:hypothetical protein
MATTRPGVDIAGDLRRLRGRWRALCVAGFALWVAGASFLALCAGLLLGHVIPRALGPLLLLGWIGAVAYVVRRVWPRTIGSRPDLHDVAGRVEDLRPDARRVLLGALQLGQRREELTHRGYDPGLLDLAVSRGEQATVGDALDVAVRPERTFAIRGAGVALAGLVALYASWALGLASSDSLRAWVTIPTAAPAALVTAVEPGDTSVVVGDGLEVTATLDRQAEDAVALEARDVGGEWSRLAMHAQDGTYVAAIRSVVGPMEYRIAVGDAASVTYHVQVLRPPAADDLRISLTFPEYTRLPAKELTPGQADITAVVGTRASLTGLGGPPLQSATLDFVEGEDVALDVEGAAFAGSFLVTQTDRYALRLVSEAGLANDGAPRHVIHAVRDEAPTVTILAPGQDTALDKSMTLTVMAEASDDFGVTEMRLHYDYAAKDVNGDARIATYAEARPTARGTYEWDVGALGLFAGDSVSYHVSVTDNDTVSGPNRAVSPTFTVRLPSLVEMFQQVADSQETQAETLGSLADAQDDVNDLVDSVMDRVRKTHELTARDRKDLEQAVEMEERIEEQRAELAAEMAKALEEAARNELLSMDTLEQIAEMHRLLDEVASEELKAAMQKLQDALEQESMAGQEQDMMAADFNQEQFSERIEQMIQLLEKMQRSQQLEKALRIAEELVEQQKQVVEDTEQLNRELGDEQPASGSDAARDSERLSDQEDRIAERTGELREQLDTAEAALREDDSLQQVADEADRLGGEMDTRGIQEQLQQAGGEFARSNPQGAQEPASEALRELQYMEQQLNNAMEFMQGAGGEELQAALTDAMREIMHLSRTHESLAEDGARRNAPAQGRPSLQLSDLGDLALGEQIVADGVDAVAAKLQALSQEDVQIPLELMFHLRDAADAVQRSSVAFAENEPGRATPIQRDALAKLNRVALEMLDALNALNAQQGGQGMQNMMEQMQQLAEGQGDLNRQTQGLEQMMREQGSAPGMEDSLRRMAFEQSLIRDAFQRIEEKMRAMEQGLGELGGVEGDMEAVERRLEASDVDQDVLERMRRIETRMLESAKALQKRQTGKSRKAKIADRIFAAQEGVERPDWSAADEFTDKLLRSADADAPEAYRAQVRAYFRALADTGGGSE